MVRKGSTVRVRQRAWRAWLRRRSLRLRHVGVGSTRRIRKSSATALWQLVYAMSAPQSADALETVHLLSILRVGPARRQRRALRDLLVLLDRCLIAMEPVLAMPTAVALVSYSISLRAHHFAISFSEVHPAARPSSRNL